LLFYLNHGTVGIEKASSLIQQPKVLLPEHFLRPHFVRTGTVHLDSRLVSAYPILPVTLVVTLMIMTSLIVVSPNSNVVMSSLIIFKR